MAELLLELLSEEIPARMQARAADDLRRLVIKGLEEAGLTFTEARSFATPRRLAIVVDGLPVKQPDVTEERKGPRADAPEKAIQGFLKGNDLTLDQCEKRTTPKGEFYFAVKTVKGRPLKDVFHEIIYRAVWNFPWLKSMTWGDLGLRWIRPLHGALLVFDGTLLSIDIPLLHPGKEEGGGKLGRSLGTSNTTFGHRFLAPGVIEVKDFADYRAKLEKAKVMLDPAERREAIAGQAEKLAKKENLTVKADDDLLAEVAGLVEWPVALVGRIDEAFMDLPQEVLTTVMRHHQKYFSLLDAKGRLAPRFIAVANTEAADGGAAIVAGNERVLRARLADARYFWDQDRKRSLESRVANLAGMVFQEKLGSVLDKAERMAKLARVLAETTGADADLAERAARLAKADLTTEMVVEFPELQGVMGRYYALADGEPAEVAEAVADHYAPQGPADRCPAAPVSVAVALADKMDTLVGFWGIEEKPTGSKDPFALRRAALGVIRLILENKLTFSVRMLIERAWENHPQGHNRSRLNTFIDDLTAFFFDRLKVFLRDKGVRYDLIDALFARGGEDDLLRIVQKAEVLGQFLDTDDGINLLVAYRRANNIVRIEEKKRNETYASAPDENKFEQDEEHALWKALNKAIQESGPRLDMAQFDGAILHLADLRKPIDAFFDRVTVNCDDAGLRTNRLRLLWEISATMNGVADFSQIEG